MRIRRLGKDDGAAMTALNRLFAEVFEEPEEYLDHWPDEAALGDRLADPNIYALVAEDGEAVVGGLAGYLLPKLESPRAELFIYDLAVAESHRRKGVATALLWEARRLAGEAGAWVAFIQADQGDEPPLALYRKLASEEIVAHHFDLPING